MKAISPMAAAMLAAANHPAVEETPASVLERATRWLTWNSKAIAHYLRGQLVHASGGKREGRSGSTFIRSGRAERKARQRAERARLRWQGTKPGQRGAIVRPGFAKWPKDAGPCPWGTGGEKPPFTGRRHKQRETA